MGSFWQLQTPKWLTLWGENWSQNGWLTVLQRRVFCSSLLQHFWLCTKDVQMSFNQTILAVHAALQDPELMTERKGSIMYTSYLIIYTSLSMGSISFDIYSSLRTTRYARCARLSRQLNKLVIFKCKTIEAFIYMGLIIIKTKLTC